MGICHYPEPEPEGLVCLTFQYGIENDLGLTADDIESGIDNTYKSDLIIATRAVVIEVLNETFPEGRALQGNAADRPQWKALKDNQLLGVIDLGVAENPRDGQTRNMQGRRRAVFLPSSREEQIDSMDKNRRLAIYTDSYPPDILNVFDNPFCSDADEDTACAIVETRVCVILEEGDDEDEVKDQLLDGIGKAFQDGRFESSIVP